MWRQRAIEWSFVLCRLLLTYAGMVVFLAMPPMVKLSQALALQLNQRESALTVPLMIPPSTRAEATHQAVSIVWLGQRQPTLYTPHEYSHLRDVHMLFVWGGAVVGLAVCWAIYVERYTARLWVARVYKRLIIGLFGLSVIGVVTFEWMFTFFHYLFFPQGNFAFSVGSLLIQSFPPLFWVLDFVLLQLGVMILLWIQSHHAERVGI